MPKGYLLGQTSKDRLEKVLGKDLPSTVAQRLDDADLPASVMIQTPSGGIPAATISGDDVTYGEATCKFVITWLDDSTKKGRITERDIKVYNNFLVQISGNAIVHAKLIGADYFVDTDNCGA